MVDSILTHTNRSIANCLAAFLISRTVPITLASGFPIRSTPKAANFEANLTTNSALCYTHINLYIIYYSISHIRCFITCWWTNNWIFYLKVSMIIKFKWKLCYDVYFYFDNIVDYKILDSIIDHSNIDCRSHNEQSGGKNPMNLN